MSRLRRRADLPSWAPDWSHLRISERHTLAQIRDSTSLPFAAAGDSTAESSIIERLPQAGKELQWGEQSEISLCHIKGFVTDTIIYQSDCAALTWEATLLQPIYLSCLNGYPCLNHLLRTAHTQFRMPFVMLSGSPFWVIETFSK